MVSNLKAARQAIEAELSHAQKGMAYYISRVEALEVALLQLQSVESETSAAGPKTGEPQRGRKARGPAQGGGAKRGPKPRAAGSNKADSLPSTGGDFWLKLVSNQPQSAVDISNAAISALGITPDQKGRIQKLKQRVSPALASLVASQKIKDTGAGRERRFFKE